MGTILDWSIYAHQNDCRWWFIGPNRDGEQILAGGHQSIRRDGDACELGTVGTSYVRPIVTYCRMIIKRSSTRLIEVRRAKPHASAAVPPSMPPMLRREMQASLALTDGWFDPGVLLLL